MPEYILLVLYLSMFLCLCALVCLYFSGCKEMTYKHDGKRDCIVYSKDIGVSVTYCTVHENWHLHFFIILHLETSHIVFTAYVGSNTNNVNSLVLYYSNVLNVRHS